ncbi:imelysin family protein [Candidatus Thiodiazotropha sp. CDECU1]|uniref:imelysin family protein n=1 Tax=Candidatus Thiodiazotropha sp. CDECU1 TaxID=3065865 RepID=UPI00293114E9|nr:imelysin family protein [Candidatus Thiodiazotropha sp. CDECU1]
MMMKTLLFLVASMVLVSPAWAAPDEKAVLSHYADLAHAMYQDSLITAKILRKSVNELVSEPSEANLAAAKEAWKNARIPYQQTEAYRFGNPIVDDWEGKVNAWPLDEGLIDYVAASYGDESDENPYYTANIIAHKRIKVGGREIDATKITKQLLAETLHELDEIEANVATGYHAIEFLLWGQDLNGNGPGAGTRPASDFDSANCTSGNCQRRAAYLSATTELLIDELSWMTAQWAPGGEARSALSRGNPLKGIGTILTGMGSLSYGELAGERMKLGVMLHDPEEEHDCFSDNTHWSHYYDALGVKNVYTGSYTRINGSRISGPSMSDLVAAKNPSIDKALQDQLDHTLTRMQALVDSAEKDGVAYDQLIAEGNKAGNAKVLAAVDALVAQTKGIERAVAVLDLTPIAFEGSDSLDAPNKVFE